MMNVEEFVDDFLMHYSNANYDPRKRREYYLRTRQLKGRMKGKGDDAEPREFKGKPGKQGDKEPKKASPSPYQRAVERLYNKAQNHLERLSEKFAEALESRDAKIDRQTREKIENLPPIPKWVQPETKARLMEARSANIARITTEAANKKTSVRETMAGRQDRQRKQVANDLKAAVEKARKAYAKKSQTVKDGGSRRHLNKEGDSQNGS